MELVITTEIFITEDEVREAVKTWLLGKQITVPIEDVFFDDPCATHSITVKTQTLNP